ncbi:MAG: type II 3-dehydroquinate dehydratase [Elsteraceae bacterium]
MPNRRIDILNGPSMNLLGRRQTHLYGHEALEDVEASCRPLAARFAAALRWRQSNDEAILADWIQSAARDSLGIIINPGGLTFTSQAIPDALSACGLPVIEVHVSNLIKRERFRHFSRVSIVADAVVAGFGVQGYALAIERMAELALGECPARRLS